jgi:hypothetical protein
MKRTTVYIPFIRQEGLLTTAVAVVKLTTKKVRASTTSYVEALKEAVNYWALNTKAGKKCNVYAGGDLNIGDLAMYSTAFRVWLKNSVKIKTWAGDLVDCEILFAGEVPDAASYDTYLTSV